jgi:hypothetical protein
MDTISKHHIGHARHYGYGLCHTIVRLVPDAARRFHFDILEMFALL